MFDEPLSFSDTNLHKPCKPAAWPVLASLGKAQDEEFNELAELAAAVVGTPLSLLTLFDDEYQYHKGALGFTSAQVPRKHSLCDHAFAGDALLVISDAAADPRFRNYPAVTEQPSIRFYAGLPLYAPSGSKAGTLCVLDSVRRDLKPWQARALTLLARQANTRIELHMRRLEAERAVASAAHSSLLFSTFANELPFPCYLKDGEHRLVFYNRRLCELFNISPQDWLGRTSFDLLPAEIAARLLQAEQDVLITGEQSELRIHIPASATRPAASWVVHYSRCRVAGGQPLLAALLMPQS